MNKSDHMNSFGIFSQASYTTIGDKYQEKRSMGRELKKGGRQMLTGIPKSGKVGDGVSFDKFKPLFEGDPYVDASTFQRKYEQEQRKRIKHGPFRPSSPPKKSSGLGNTYGTIGKPYEYVSLKMHEKKKRSPEPKNLLTNPSKKGTYGMTGLLFSELPTSIGGTREEKVKPKKFVGKPFSSTAKPLDTFDSYSNVAASKIYTLDRPLPPEKKPHRKSEDGPKRVPFRPSSSSKSGMNGIIGKYPEYVPDEYEKFKIKSKQDAEKAGPKKVWRSVSGSKSMPTRSVIFGSTL